jgi:hypothetical protein
MTRDFVLAFAAFGGGWLARAHYDDGDALTIAAVTVAALLGLRMGLTP